MASLNTTFGTAKGIKGQMNSELKELNKTYDTSGAQKYYDQLINSANDYKTTQTNLQNQMTDQAINEINQNKEYQRQDYLKEQKGAYTDYQKQADKFANEGTNFRHSGVSETAQTQMYTAYQNRVATARDTYNRAVTNYDNQITNARLQNNKVIAEIAYNTLQQTLQLGLESFQYQQDMRIKRYESGNAVRDRAYNRWSDMRTFKESKRQFDKSFNGGSGGGSSRSYSYSSGSSSRGSSGGNTNTSGGSTINKTKSALNTKYTTNYSPAGLSKAGLKASNNLASIIQKNGYATGKQIQNATKGLSKEDKALISGSMKKKK